jgi:hypothetical protein
MPPPIAMLKMVHQELDRADVPRNHGEIKLTTYQRARILVDEALSLRKQVADRHEDGGLIIYE